MGLPPRRKVSTGSPRSAVRGKGCGGRGDDGKEKCEGRANVESRQSHINKSKTKNKTEKKKKNLEATESESLRGARRVREMATAASTRISRKRAREAGRERKREEGEGVGVCGDVLSIIFLRVATVSEGLHLRRRVGPVTSPSLPRWNRVR